MRVPVKINDKLSYIALSLRGGRTTRVIPNKKKKNNRNACRRWKTRLGD